MNILFRLFVVSIFLTLSTSAYAQWQQCNGPYGGWITALAKNGNTAYAASHSGGVYKSTNFGDSWQAIGLKDKYINSLLVFEGNVYVAANYDGLYKSTNEGETWEHVNTTINRFYPRYIAEHFGVLFVTSENSMFYRSTDKGKTWDTTKVNQFPFSSDNVYCSIEYNNTLLVGFQQYSTIDTCIYKSIDSGRTWIPTNMIGKYITSLSVFDNILFASTEQQGIYRSTDGGNTWLPANNGITYKGIGSFAVNDNTILAGSATGIFRSTNNGESWSEVNTQIKGEYCWRLFVINDSTVLAGTLKGIFKSTDFGLTWRNTSSGITSHVILPIAEYNSDIYVGTINSGIYKSSDNGDSWTNIGVPYSPSGYSGNPYSIAGTDSTLFIRNDRDSLYKQNKISTLWEKVVPEPTTYYLNEIVSIKNVVILNTARGLYKSTDNGISWNKIKVDSTLANSQRFDLLFKHKEYLFVVSDNPKKLLRSSDLGNSWIRCNSGLNYLSFRLFTSNRNIIYAFIDFNDSSRFYKSYDDGFTWQRIFIPFIDMSPIRYTTSSSSNVIVASDTGGVLRSTDYGATWHNITSGLLNKKILSLYIKGTTLFAGTDGAGVWKYNLLSTDIPEQPSISGTHVRCYPNPANDELTISLTTSTELQQPLQYSITNILGTSVLQSQQMEKECTIPIHTLPSGVYYVTVAQSGVNATTMFSVVR